MQLTDWSTLQGVLVAILVNTKTCHNFTLLLTNVKCITSFRGSPLCKSNTVKSGEPGIMPGSLCLYNCNVCVPDQGRMGTRLGNRSTCRVQSSERWCPSEWNFFSSWRPPANRTSTLCLWFSQLPNIQWFFAASFSGQLFNCIMKNCGKEPGNRATIFTQLAAIPLDKVCRVSYLYVRCVCIYICWYVFVSS